MNKLLIDNESSHRMRKKETLVQVFSWEFCKICNGIFFTEHLWATASEEKQPGKYSRK